jgi:hypothetical protein
MWHRFEVRTSRTPNGAGARCCNSLALAATAAAIAVAASTVTLLSGAGSALAPEPAKLASKLDARTGATAALYINTSAPTKVVYWGSSWSVSANGPAAGTPCSSYPLAADAITRQVIQTFTSGTYTYRRCL